MIFVGGLVLLVQTFLSQSALSKLLIVVPSAAALILLWFYAAGEDDLEDTPATLPGWSILTVFPFFHARFDFLNSAFTLSRQAVFKFKLLQVRRRASVHASSADLRCLQYTVIAVSGAEGRRDFLTSRGLDINEGFKLLSGAVSSSVVCLRVMRH